MHHNIMRPMSCREVLGIVRKLDAERASVSFRRFRRETGITRETIEELFGNWRRLREAAGRPRVRRNEWRKISNQQIVERLREQIQLSGERVTEADFCKLTGLTVYQIHARFGSWRQLRELAGTTPKANPRKVYTDRELLDDLLRVYLLTGKNPSQTLHQARGGKFDPPTFKARFGSWKEVKELFGLYMYTYFFLRDRDWTPEIHKLTFRPGPHHQLEWPEQLLKRMSWLSPQGDVTLREFFKEHMERNRTQPPEQAAAGETPTVI